MSSVHACHRCGRELRGAIESHYMSLGRLVCITAIETPDCNWIRCWVCRNAVCGSCYLPVSGMCAGCQVARIFRWKSNPGDRNGSGPEGPRPMPTDKAA